MEEQLLEIIPIIVAITVMLGLFGTIMGYKRRGKTKEEEETKEEKDNITEAIDEVRSHQKIRPWKKK